ncbi:Protein of unknown function [Alteribacillus persepolensis]|uniref:4 TMS phage holin, superfamily IV n=1 Tax=Alteribacillus persepolensis TaxID=568899 RepID=A0A1G8GE27_9BACI|nr:DUF2512 family protein [Alteribacillus persepolensis]SDH92615.1 Protein of unknown function [Alteribacillus persepolensis]
MSHITALLIKTALVLFVLLVLLSLINGYPGWNTIGLSVVVVLASYLIGDMFILKATNNWVSTLADVGLCTLVIWLIGPLLLNEAVPFFLAFFSALLIGAGEWFFHKYVARAILDKNTKAYS